MVGKGGWREEFAARVALREFKMKFLGLVDPCRSFALFLPDDRNDEAKTGNNDGSGEAESKKGKGEKDSEEPTLLANADDETPVVAVRDSITLTNTLLSFVVGDAAATAACDGLARRYDTSSCGATAVAKVAVAKEVACRRLGLSHRVVGAPPTKSRLCVQGRCRPSMRQR